MLASNGFCSKSSIRVEGLGEAVLGGFFEAPSMMVALMLCHTSSPKLPTGTIWP